MVLMQSAGGFGRRIFSPSPSTPFLFPLSIKAGTALLPQVFGGTNLCQEAFRASALKKCLPNSMFTS